MFFETQCILRNQSCSLTLHHQYLCGCKMLLHCLTLISISQTLDCFATLLHSVVLSLLSLSYSRCSVVGDLRLIWAITPAAREAGKTSHCTAVVSLLRAVTVYQFSHWLLCEINESMG